MEETRRRQPKGGKGKATVREPLPCGQNVIGGKVCDRNCKDICAGMSNSEIKQCFYTLARVQAGGHLMG
jgi:hypothetical protein